MDACTYAIKNIVSGKTYVGSTIQVVRRWHRHRLYLCGNRHENSHLQRAWNKYGEDNFEFVVLEIVDNATLLIEREQHWLNLYRANGGAYNFSACAKAPWLGRHHTEETRRKISAAFKGRHLTKEHRQKLSVAAKGKRHTEKRRRDTGAAHAKPYPVLVDPNGTIYPAGTNLVAFCRERGLDGGHMCKVVHGKRKHHKGWRLAELPK